MSDKFKDKFTNIFGSSYFRYNLIDGIDKSKKAREKVIFRPLMADSINGGFNV